MKIGILQCDDVRSSLQPQYGNYPHMFKALLSLTGNVFDYRVYRVIDGEFPNALDECDAYLATGSRYSAYDDMEWIHQLHDLVVELYLQQKKLIGICFGHQVIARALGGEVAASPKGWGIGVSIAQIKRQTGWMTDKSEELKLVVSHKDQVVREPEQAQIIAGSEFCPCAVMQIDNHFLSIQGHPEFSHSYIHDLMLMRADSIPSDRISAGLASLSIETDEKRVVDWISAFLLKSD